MRKGTLFGILAAMSDALVGAATVAPAAAQAVHDITVAEPQRRQPPVGNHAADIRTFEQELQHGRV